jgi:hypothetical protein
LLKGDRCAANALVEKIEAVDNAGVGDQRLDVLVLQQIFDRQYANLVGDDATRVRALLGGVLGESGAVEGVHEGGHRLGDACKGGPSAMIPKLASTFSTRGARVGPG